MPERTGRPERADAARNRQAILAAAEDLLLRYEPADVSIERIAAAAGVGKGTVFHRFGSRAELMQALAHSRTDQLQAEILQGPPPLGPGAPPRDRLLAFIDAVVRHAARSYGLLSAAEHAALTSKASAAGRPDNPIYRSWHAHVQSLLSQVRPDLDAELQAHLILGALHDPVVGRMLRDGQAERVARTMRQLADALLG